MAKDSFIIKSDEIYVGTWFLSQGFKVEHRALKRLVNRYKNEFESVGVVTTALQQPTSKKGGHPVEEFLLNEVQATYLGTLLTNNTEVRRFKLALSKGFHKQRRLLNSLLTQRQNAEWIAKRDAGKIERRKETDTIKRFVEYAEANGSQNAKKYYMIITKMQNQALFSLEFLEQKYPNIRDMVDGFSLDILKMSDYVVDRAIDEGLDRELPYKEIYVLAKERVTAFASAIGKCPIRQALEVKRDNVNLIEDKKD